MRLKFLLFVTPVVFSSILVFAQSPGSGIGVNQWKTNGNFADENHFIGTKNDFPIKFRTNNIERLRISPDGNVGIGISDPIEKLDVLGNVLFRNNLILPGIQNSNITSNQPLFIDGNGVVYKGTINQIAEVVYQPKLCIDGPIPSPTWSNGVNKIYVACPQVNVGINTSLPRVNLDVQGISYTNSIKIGTVDPLTSTVRFHMKSNALPSSTSTQLLIESEQQQLLSLNYQGLLISRSQIIDVSNNLTTPFIIKNSSQKLLQVDNNGLLHARRIKVDTDSWADFVFDKEYYLMPLCELKNFINENNHLPNVPSEKDIIANGIDLGEFNKLLLQKVEELTRYILIQQDEINELKKNINK